MTALRFDGITGPHSLPLMPASHCYNRGAALTEPESQRAAARDPGAIDKLCASALLGYHYI